MIRIGSIGPSVALGALLALGPGAVHAAPQRLTASLPTEIETAHRSLVEALAELGQTPTLAALAKADRAMARIDRALDTYYHAPNLLQARPLALAARPAIQRLRSGDDAVLVVANDALHFTPDIHARLAAACTALGDHRGALRHHLDRLAVDPAPAHLRAAAEAAEAAGDEVAAAALRSRAVVKDQAGTPP